MNKKTQNGDYIVPDCLVLSALTLGVICQSTESGSLENYDFTDFEM